MVCTKGEHKKQGGVLGFLIKSVTSSYSLQAERCRATNSKPHFQADSVENSPFMLLPIPPHSQTIDFIHDGRID